MTTAKKLTAKQKRQRIIDYAKEHKEQSFTTNEIEADLSLNYGGSVYYLNKLCKEGLVFMEKGEKMSTYGHPRIANFYRYAGS